MAEIDFQVKFKDGVAAEGARGYLPGATVSGIYEIVPQSNIRCRKAEIRLEWYTEGKGDRDGEVIDSREIAAGDLMAGKRIGDAFVFQLPSQPWSYAGYFITVVWAITVKIDVPMGKDIIRSVRLIMAPP